MENTLEETMPGAECPPIRALRARGRGVLSRARRAGLAAAALTMLGIALSACAETGPEPVPLDQNPGDNGAPTATGS